ncbi:hypothetical protein [Paraburkholderia youngii]|uniref:hypothetical protein n=1 Tax=Paraburkholderia youngii TaxID=2782701 RepID=UPI003D1C1BE3
MRARFSSMLSFTMLLALAPYGAQCYADAAAAGPAPLTLAGRSQLPGYTGDFDHFAVDVKGNRLFLAGEDGGTLEVFNLKTGQLERTVKGFEQPHSILYLPEQNRLIVTDSGDSMTKVMDATTYRIVGKIQLAPGADSMFYDPSRKHIYVVTGGKNASRKMADTIVSEVDPRTGKRIGDIRFDTDFTESMAAEQKGNRLFINVTGKSQVAVVNKNTRAVIAMWPIKDGELNAPMKLDEENHRLFVVTRKPFRLLVLNSDTGEEITSFKAPERTNEMLFDAANRRIYLAGDDYLYVIQQKDADHYEDVAHVASAKGAKTAVLVPALRRVYTAVSPGDEKVGGELLWFNVNSGSAKESLAGK